METQAQNVLEYSENSGPLFSGLVCHSLQPPVAQVCELEARSTCHGNECLQSQLAGPPRLHFLTICSVMEVPSENEKERELTVVLIAPHWQAQVWFPALLELVMEDPLQLPRLHNLLISPSGNSHPLTSQGELQLVIWKVSGDSSSRVITAGWSQGTNTAYNSGCRRWSCWCESRHVDPFQEALLRFHGGVYLLRVSSKGPLIAVIQLSPWPNWEFASRSASSGEETDEHLQFKATPTSLLQHMGGLQSAGIPFRPGS